MASVTAPMPNLVRRTDPQWSANVNDQAVQAEQLRRLLVREALVWRWRMGLGLLPALLLAWQQAWGLLALFAGLQAVGLWLVRTGVSSIRTTGSEAAVAAGVLRRFELVALLDGTAWGLATWSLPWAEPSLAVLILCVVVPLLLVLAVLPSRAALLALAGALWLLTLAGLPWMQGAHSPVLAVGITLFLGALAGYGLRWQRQVEQGIRAQLEKHLLLSELKKAYLLQQQQSSALAEAHLQLNSALSRHQRLVMHDELTGVLNQQAFLARARADRAQDGHSDSTACLMLIDFSGASALAPDGLRQAAQALRSGLRGHDVLARWDERAFIALLPHTHQADAEVVVQRLRPTLPDSSASFGLAEWRPDHAIDDALQRLVEQARSGLGRQQT